MNTGLFVMSDLREGAKRGKDSLPRDGRREREIEGGGGKKANKRRAKGIINLANKTEQVLV